MTHPYYFHSPGQPSRWGVVDVGLKCTHSCRFCYYSFLDGSDDQFKGMRHAKFHSRENLFALVESLAENDFLGFDVTGGEPALHPDIVPLIRRATDLGLSTRVITLGQFLMREMKGTNGDTLIRALMDAGLTNFLFSVHAIDDELFREITGESWSKLNAAMRFCQGQNFHFTTNTTVCAQNYKHLPKIAADLVTSGTYLHNFIVMNAYYEWGRKGAGTVQAHYGEVAPYLREAVSILESNCIPVNVRYAPLCTMAGLEKNIVGIVGVRYDPYEWMNRIDHKTDPATVTIEQMRDMGRMIPMDAGEPSPGAQLFGVEGKAKSVEVGAARGVPPQGIAKLFPVNCQKCHALDVCDGVDPRYLSERGDAEFVPYVGDDRGKTLDKDRLAYLAPYFVKRKPEADMRGLMRRIMKPKPISDSPKVSVIVTCHNYGQYLAQCIDSLIAQTWENVEIIVVDDGSTDDTMQIAQRYGDIVTYIWQKNSGQPAYPRNAGIEYSCGELVMCLDADDWIEPSMIEECVRMFLKHPEASIVYPGTQCFGTGDDMFAAGPYSFERLLKECIIVCCSIFRREVWEATGGYKTNVRGAEDWCQWIEAGGLGFFGAPLSRQLFHYRRHADGIFESDVVPNYPEKVRQVILNNSDLYSPDLVKKAREGAKVADRVTA